MKNKQKKIVLLIADVAMIFIVFYGYSVIGIDINTGVIIGVLIGMVINYFRETERKRWKYGIYIALGAIAAGILVMRYAFDVNIYWERLLYIGPALMLCVILFDLFEKTIIKKYRDEVD